MKSRATTLLLLLATILAVALPASAQSNTEEDPVVRAVFFFSPTCGHCELVIQEHLPVIFAQYGGEPTVLFDETLPPEDIAFYEMTNGTFDLLLVDVSIEAGADMYTADLERLAAPDSRKGVPRIDIADTYLVGSVEIPEQLPGLIGGQRGVIDQSGCQADEVGVGDGHGHQEADGLLFGA